MKVILKEDIKKLGFKDDVCEVKNGFGRNFLIPRGKAVLATPSAIKMLEEDIRQATFKQERIKTDATATSEKMNGLTITIGTKAGSNGKIFGSVTTIQVAQALKDLGYDVDRRRIVVDDIKMIGEYKATVNLHREVSVEININVVQE
jgi:large subunit ribosomal protein L9